MSRFSKEDAVSTYEAIRFIVKRHSLDKGCDTHEFLLHLVFVGDVC